MVSSSHAILIASATPTHTDYIALGAEFNKAILCEKPIDLDINKVKKDRDKLCNLLEKNGFDVLRSHTNSIHLHQK